MSIEQLRPLLEFIARAENSGRIDYDVVYGGISPADRPAHLTALTVGEVLAWQDSIDALYPSEAAGAYQIMEDTLRGLYRQAGVPLTARFDAATQDRLAVALLRRRGLDDYLAGRVGVEKFANALAREWASLPVVTGPKKGRSYYDGDGLNSAHVKVAPFLAVLRRVAQAAQPSPEPREAILQSKTILGALGGQLGNIATAVQVLPQLDGRAQVVALVGFVAVALALLFVMWERNRKWQAGAR